MGVRRTQHVSVQLAMQVVVALETAVTAEQTLVFETPHRLPDPELPHDFGSALCRVRQLPSVEVPPFRDAGADASPTYPHPPSNTQSRGWSGGARETEGSNPLSSSGESCKRLVPLRWTPIVRQPEPL